MSIRTRRARVNMTAALRTVRNASNPASCSLSGASVSSRAVHEEGMSVDAGRGAPVDWLGVAAASGAGSVAACSHRTR